MFKDFVKGTQYALSGFHLIVKKGVKRYVVVPLFINILLFSSMFYLASKKLIQFIEQLTGWWQLLEWLLWPLFIIAGFIIIFFTFAIITNFIASPFNGFLANAVEQHLDINNRKADKLNNFIYDIRMLLRSEGQKIKYFLFRAFPLFFLAFIPGLQLIWVIFAAWMLALEYIDYPMGNHDYSFLEQKNVLNEKRFLAFGFGFTIMLFTIIPFLNFIVIPVAVAGATNLWVQEIKYNLNS